MRTNRVEELTGITTERGCAPQKSDPLLALKSGERTRTYLKTSSVPWAVTIEENTQPEREAADSGSSTVEPNLRATREVRCRKQASSHPCKGMATEQTVPDPESNADERPRAPRFRSLAPSNGHCHGRRACEGHGTAILVGQRACTHCAASGKTIESRVPL